MILKNIFSNWWIMQFLKKTKLLKILKSTTQIKKRISSLDNMVADRISNKKLGPVMSELFIWRRPLNIYTIFITQFYFTIPKDVRVNCTHLFIVKIPNKTRTSANCIYSFITCWLWRLSESLRKTYCKNTFLFSEWYYCCIR